MRAAARVVLSPDAPPDMTAELVRAVLDAADHHGETLKQDRRSRVVAASHAGREWVVKRSELNPLKRFVYRPIRRTSGWKQWLGARRLRKASLPYAGPLALALRGPDEYVVMFRLEGVTLDRWWPIASREDRRGMAEALGRQLGLMHAAGLTNRDYKPTNLIIAPGAAMPVMIDLEGVRRGAAQRATLRSAAVVHRALQRVDAVEEIELSALCRGLADAAPALARGAEDRPIFLRQQLLRMHDARPLSYDAETAGG